MKQYYVKTMILFALYYTVLLKDYNSYVSHCVVKFLINEITFFLNRVACRAGVILVS